MIPYANWNEKNCFISDGFIIFKVSESLLSIYLDEYDETPWDALKYLVSYINSTLL